MKHPKNYILTRDEWLAVNRALAGAALELRHCRAKGDKRNDRLNCVQNAQDILSASYKAAANQPSVLDTGESND